MCPKILIADDDDLIQTMLSKMLSRHGYDITLVDNGEDAIKQAASERYDLVITDIMMPKVEGIEVISELVEQDPAAKIIAITSEGRAGFTNFLTIAETMGATASLKKPFTSEQLMSTIAALGVHPSTTHRTQ